MVENERFELSVPLPVRILSRDVVSTAHPVLQMFKAICFRTEIITKVDKLLLKYVNRICKIVNYRVKVE